MIAAYSLSHNSYLSTPTLLQPVAPAKTRRIAAALAIPSTFRASNMIGAITSKNEYVRAVNADGVAILEATATWCPQCRTMAPVLDQLATKYPNARFYSFDVDATPDIAQELGVRQMPTFSVFKDGDLHVGVTGAKPKDLEDAIKEVYVE